MKTVTERWVLPNGLTVLYRLSPLMPLVSGTLLLKTGSYFEDNSQAGLASLTMDLLLAGTRRRTARQIADAVEFRGASLGVHASEDYSEMGFVAPSGQWSRVLDVLGDMLRYPTFPADEVAKERAQTLASLKSRNDSIFNLAHDRFSRMLFGSHPYSRPMEGIPRTVRSFQRKHFQTWRASQLRPDRAIFSLIGPLPARQVIRGVTRFLGPWKTSDAHWIEPSLVSVPGPRATIRAELRSRFEQAYLMTGTLAPAADDEGFITLKVLNTLLGGGMSSRLFLRLREELGLAYEVASFFPTRLHPSQWVLYMGLPEEKLVLAEKKMEELLRQLAASGPTLQEVAQAKQMIAGAYLMEHQTRRRQGWYAAWWEFLGKGADYGSQFLEEVEAVTPGDIHTLARRLLSQPRVTVTVVPSKNSLSPVRERVGVRGAR
ncbi:MAG: pitrilysin family protein [Elusimicrobiota bacterium]